MPRVARIVVPDLPHHVIQRGNDRQAVFRDDADRKVYLKFLAVQCKRFNVAILGYCLMTNHTHLIAVPKTVSALAQAIGRTHWLYAQYFNHRHRRSGHLWQNRFFSCAMDDRHCVVALRYIERNPLRARLARIASRYEWSSAAAHCIGTDRENLLNMKWWASREMQSHWSATLEDDLDDTETKQILAATRTGRPLMGKAMLKRLETRLQKRLTALKPGRPKGSSTKGKK